MYSIYWINLRICFIVCRFLKHRLLESSGSSTSVSLHSQPSTHPRFEAAPEVLPPDCFLWEGLNPSPHLHHPVTLQIDIDQAKVKAISQLMRHSSTFLALQIEEILERQKMGSIKGSILNILDRKWWTKMSCFMRQRAQMKQR